MASNKLIHVEVAYATPHQQYLIPVTLQEGSTVLTAIENSGIKNTCPEINLFNQTVGIFSRKCQLTDLVHEGDRVEIYRPLTIDPKEARRAKAKKRILK